MKSSNLNVVALCALAGFAASAMAQTIHPEVEPNDNKAQALANGAFVLAPGDGVTGQSQGSVSSGGGLNSRDYFLIRTTPQSLGIYRHTLTLTVDVGNLHSSVNIRGLSQSTAGVINQTSDASLQFSASVTPTRQSSWYGFGREEQLFYAVSGNTNTTGTYTAVLSTEPVTPTGHLGTLQEGTIEFSTVMQTTFPTTIMILDSNLNPIPDYINNFEPVPGETAGSRLTRSFAPGSYYLVIGRWNVATSLASAPDDRRRNSNVTDFPDLIVGSSSSSTGVVNFSAVDQYGPVGFSQGINERHQVHFFTFDVGTVTDVGACCLPDGSCVTSTAASCATQEGTYSGVGSDCSAVTCDQPGACCVDPYGCLVLSESQCTSVAGTYGGHGSPCATAGCNPAVITWIDVFSGDATENLSSFPTSTSQGCLRVFDNQADLCPMSGHFWLVQSWSSSCSLSAMPGSLQIGGTSGGTRFTFDVPVERFGAYFANAQGQPEMFADFFAPDGTPIAPTITLPNHFPDCTWRWNGWEFAQPVQTIEFRGTGGGSWASLSGEWQVDWWDDDPCYADCNGDDVLNVADFLCFIDEFAVAQTLPPAQQQTHYANCTGATAAPFLTVADFLCFIDEFAQGCP